MKSFKPIQINTFGDSKRHRCLISLTEIINEYANPNYSSKVSKIVNQYHVKFEYPNVMATHKRLYLLELIKNDFLNNLDHNVQLPENIKTHLRTYIIGYWRYRTKIIKSHQVFTIPISDHIKTESQKQSFVRKLKNQWLGIKYWLFSI